MSLRMLLCTVAASLTVLAAAPASSDAQERHFVPMLDSIGPGCCTIRVRQNGLTAQGNFLGRPDAGSVLLGDCSGPLCGTVSDPSRGLKLLPGALVEMKSGTHAGMGLIIGAASGAGLLLGLVLVDGCDCEMSAGDYALLAGVGAAGGGLIGTLVGAFIPNWVPVRH